MCRFIKEDGERCGMDSEPFCHMHEDTPQSHFYFSMEELKEDLSEVMSMADEARSAGANGDSSGIVMERTCDNCDSPLRRTERLTEHPNQPNHVVFEAVVECDCSEHVLGAQSVRDRNVPEGWSS